MEILPVLKRYCQTCNIRCTLGNKIIDDSDVDGALPIGTTANFRARS